MPSLKAPACFIAVSDLDVLLLVLLLAKLLKPLASSLRAIYYMLLVFLIVHPDKQANGSNIIQSLLGEHFVNGAIDAQQLAVAKRIVMHQRPSHFEAGVLVSPSDVRGCATVLLLEASLTEDPATPPASLVVSDFSTQSADVYLDALAELHEDPLRARADSLRVLVGPVFDPFNLFLSGIHLSNQLAGQPSLEPPPEFQGLGAGSNEAEALGTITHVVTHV
mmetsp:Transcript_20419/g.38291  ORF Transcript_20419/g.38291 Transcript_20419/m.38291 type:complete len:221 (+) Transcript_20419:285-947(+)